MSRPFELLVFDWDGTLMDSEEHIVASMERAIDDLALPSLPRSRLRDVIGLGLAEAIERLYPEIAAPLQLQIKDRYRYHFLAEDPCEPFAGAGEVLRGLEKQGYLLAVATGKGRGGLDRVLDSTGFRPFFHATRTAEETRSKPHPQMLEEVITLCGAEPAVTLMIGDTEYDLEMARNAGVTPLAVSYGVHAVDRLRRHEPAGVLDDIRQLPAWLETAAQDDSGGESL